MPARTVTGIHSASSAASARSCWSTSSTSTRPPWRRLAAAADCTADVTTLRRSNRDVPLATRSPQIHSIYLFIYLFAHKSTIIIAIKYMKQGRTARLTRTPPNFFLSAHKSTIIIASSFCKGSYAIGIVCVFVCFFWFVGELVTLHLPLCRNSFAFRNCRVFRLSCLAIASDTSLAGGVEYVVK